MIYPLHAKHWGHHNEEKHSLSKTIILYFNCRHVFHNVLTALEFFHNNNHKNVKFINPPLNEWLKYTVEFLLWF